MLSIGCISCSLTYTRKIEKESDTTKKLQNGRGFLLHLKKIAYRPIRYCNNKDNEDNTRVVTCFETNSEKLLIGETRRHTLMKRRNFLGFKTTIFFFSPDTSSWRDNEFLDVGSNKDNSSHRGLFVKRNYFRHSYFCKSSTKNRYVPSLVSFQDIG